MATNTWGTPQYVFDFLNEAFGPFDIDVAADNENHKCDLWWTPEQDGLKQLWGWHHVESLNRNARVWCNPPYDNIGPWVARAAQEAQDGLVDSVTLLLPVRTDQKWWQETVMRFACAIYFIKGRIAFVREGKTNCSFEPSMIVRFCRGNVKAAPTFGTLTIPKQGRLV